MQALRTSTKVISLITLLLTLSSMTGCCNECGYSSQTKLMDTGTAISGNAELPCGSTFIDFKFCDGQDQIKSLDQIKGDFTILIFNSCDKCYNTALTSLVDFADRKSSWLVKIVGVNVFWTKDDPETCKTLPQTCEALPEFSNEHFYAINDAHNTIRKTYGVKSSNRYFIINPLGKIVAKGQLTTTDSLQATVEAFVADHLKEEEYFQKES